MHNPFRYFNSSPEVIRSAVMLYVRFPLSLRQVEDLLNERGIDVSYETVRYWWNRFGPLFAAEIPSMLRSITTSTTNAISTVATFSNKPEPRRWPSGVNLQPKSPQLKVLQVQPI